MPTVSLDSRLWGTTCVLDGDIWFSSLVTLQVETCVSQLQRSSTVASEQALVTSVSLSLVRKAALGNQQTCLGPVFSSSYRPDCRLDGQASVVFCSLYA